MIETRGMIGAIVAADTMLKSANVRLVGKEYTSGGLLMVTVTGDVGAVKSAVESAAAAVQQVGILRSAHVIPRLDDQVEKIIPICFDTTEPSLSPKAVEEATIAPQVPEEDWEALTVIELRQLARKRKDIGLKGREISKASKEQLIKVLAKKANL